MDLILTVSVSLAAALVLGYVTQRLGLSPLVGYLVAGMMAAVEPLDDAVQCQAVVYGIHCQSILQTPERF